MNRKWKMIGVLVLSGAAARGQEPDLRKVEEQLQALRNRGFGAENFDRQRLELELDKARQTLAQLGVARIPDGALEAASMALMAQELNFAQTGKSRDDRDYLAGTSDLDRNHFEDAVRHFEASIAAKSSRADGACYWKAYAQNRLGRRADAMATIAELRRNFPQSRWLDEAQALEVEMQSRNGKANPEAESNEELKLIALNSLMQSDPKQAIPILKKVLTSNQSPAIKDKALFVLSQSGSPEARQTILEIARGSNPDLQLKAVRYINMMGGDELRGELAKIYSSSADLNLKREIIRSYLLSGSKTQLLQAAKSEPNPELRREAVRTLAQMGAKDEVWGLYKSENSPELKEEMVRSMLMDDDSGHLLEIAKNEKDKKLRKEAINTLALTGWGKDGSALVEMYRSEQDESVKRELIKGLFLQQNARGLIELARSEKNPEMKRDIVSQLSLIQSKEATDYMMELLK